MTKQQLAVLIQHAVVEHKSRIDYDLYYMKKEKHHIE